MSNEISQWEDVHAVLNRKQNFAIVEKRKAPNLFEILANGSDVLPDADGREEVYVTFNVSAEGNEMIVSRPGYFQAYLDLLEARPQYTRQQFQVAMGTLLGYDEASVEEFILSDVAHSCECSKCGGPLNLGDLVDNNARPGLELPYLYCDDWDSQDMTAHPVTDVFGDVYCTLMPVDYELVARSAGIQDWSKKR